MDIKPTLAAILAEHYPAKMTIGGPELPFAEWNILCPHIHWQSWEAQSLDAILLLDWLENQSLPAESLQNMHRHLKSQGDLWLAVPNVRYLKDVLALCQDAWPYHTLADGVTPHPQLHFFTREYLAELLTQTGWDALEWHPLGHPLNEQGQALIAAFDKLGWSTAGIQADAHVAYWVVRAGQTQVKTTRLVTPLNLSGLKYDNLLMTFAWEDRERWWPVIGEFARKIPLDAPVAGVLVVEGIDEETLISEVAAALAAQGLDPENMPDLIVPENFHEGQYDALYQAIDTVVLLGTAAQNQSVLAHVKRAQSQVLWLQAQAHELAQAEVTGWLTWEEWLKAHPDND